MRAQRVQVPSIAEKSTGQLVDELVTNGFKTAFASHQGRSTDEYEARYELLREALEQRLGIDAAGLIHNLAMVSLATWEAQEVVMHESADASAARAGRQSQRLNAHRTRWIREIDRLLGEAQITITTKTYG